MPDEDKVELSGSISSGSPTIRGNLTVRPGRESSLSATDELPPALPPIERIRFRIAIGVLCGFFCLIAVPTIAFFIAIFVTESGFIVDDFVRVVTTLSAATAGLAGAVVGYYFGQNSNA